MSDDPVSAIKAALRIINRPRSAPGPIVSAELDQYGVVRAFDASGQLVAFCHEAVWHDVRRALGCTSLEPERVFLHGAEELYDIKVSPSGGVADM